MSKFNEVRRNNSGAGRYGLSRVQVKHVNIFEVPTIHIAWQMVSRGNLDCALFEFTAFDFAVKNHTNNTLIKKFSKPVITSQILLTQCI